MSSRRWLFLTWAIATAILLYPIPAHAQWYVGIFLGANHTQSAAVSIDQPALQRSLTFEDVDFEARPFASPQYYGWRVGRSFGAERRFAAEFEFIHAKVIAKTQGVYPVSGLLPEPVVPPPMNSIVARYAMSHGLNFLLGNVAWRTPLGNGPMTMVLRGGLGPTVPHAESTIGGLVREQYEYGGIGGQAGAGIEFRFWRFVAPAVEYKFTYARPTISVDQGTGRTTAASHQVAVGLAFGTPR
jgi:hypothetical protein